jgi:hypothetical protein
VATVDAPGDFDTHDDQAATLVRDLAQLSQGLSAFQADLEARGIADRVLTLVWTEFGRRPQENSSGGTDHGAGGIAWVMGARARGGPAVALSRPQRLRREDNLKVTTDFRAVYASLLEQWLGTGADEVLPDAGPRRARRAGRMTAYRRRARSRPADDAVGLGMREYRFSVYRSSVHAGRVTLQHDELRRGRTQPARHRARGYRSAVSRDVEPRRAPALHGPLCPRPVPTGCVCLKPGHAAKGMKATLRVIRRT